MSIEKQDNIRILVLGAPGSGKSTLTLQLSKILNIEAIHLDKYYWKPDWVETGSHEWARRIKIFLLRDSWIMEGNYMITLAKRIKYSNHIIYLDIPIWKSLYRIILRMIKYRNEIRPDMASGCNEKLNTQFMQFLLWTIKFHFNYKRMIMDILSGTNYKVLKNSTSIDNWINTNFQSKFTSPFPPTDHG